MRIAILLLLLVAGCTPVNPVVNTTNESFHFISECSNVAACRDLSGVFAENCCFKAAELQKNPDFCQDTGNQSGECYSSLAVLLGQGTFCRLGGIYEQEYYNRVAYKTNDLSLCPRASPEKIDNCFSTISILTNNSAGCEKAGSLTDACYFGIGSKNLDLALCEKSGQFNETCINMIAVAKKDISLCNRLTKLKTSCLESIGK